MNEKNTITILLPERLDSSNAPEEEKVITELVAGKEGEPVVLDAKEMEYISSAGLRLILHLKKTNNDVCITNVNPNVYEILEMTGFTEMMKVEKVYRVVSVEGCEEIGCGANGTIYRIDQDNVVKVYNNQDSLEDIKNEREVAKLALILGIPTAISYDIVRVGDSFGSVFELLNASSFSNLIATQPDKIDWCVAEFVKMLKKIHETEVPEGKLCDIKDTAIDWARFVQEYLPAESGDKLISMIEDIPYDNHMIHGDYHTKNLELQGEEVLIIDMDTLATGNPIFEFASIYNALIGFSEYDHNNIMEFQGFDFETAQTFWKKSLSVYFDTEDGEKLREIEDRSRIIGYTRMIRRSIRRKGLEDENKKAEIELWKTELMELLERIDDLRIDDMIKNDSNPHRDELDIEAAVENLREVLSFVDKKLDGIGCPLKIKLQINLAVEEIFVNIANYAYLPDKGNATVRVEVEDDPLMVVITFIDKGVPYDPLARQDPDISLSAEQRRVGGLGIFLTKKTMDDLTYEYKDGQNILKMKKAL